MGRTWIYDGATGEPLRPLEGTAMAATISADQEALFYATTAGVIRLPLADIEGVPDVGPRPVPADGSTVTMPLKLLSWRPDPRAVRYRVYLGTDPIAVASANPTSALLVGESIDPWIEAPADLALEAAYYWRVDSLGWSQELQGPVWSFDAPPAQVEPQFYSASVPAASAPQTVEVEIDSGESVGWSASESLAWLRLETAQGETPGVIQFSVDPRGLELGHYSGEISVVAGGVAFELPVAIEVVPLDLRRLVTDYDRPYVYGLHSEFNSDREAYVVFIGTQSGEIEKTVPVGTGAEDMALHALEGRIYVANPDDTVLHVVDVETGEVLEPLQVGPDVRRIDAGRAGRLVVKGRSSGSIRILDTTTGASVGSFDFRTSFQPAVTDPTGSWYYDLDSNSSGRGRAPHQ